MKILIPLLVMLVLGFILGFIISLVSIKFKVEEDTRLEKIKSMLPGVNCGGCGEAGCSQFGEKLFNKEVPITNCKVLKGDPKEKLEEYIKENL